MIQASRDALLSEQVRAALMGGAVTCERLLRAARLAGRHETPLLRSLLGQPLPSQRDLARAYEALAGLPRLRADLLAAPARAARQLDPALLRRARCVPLEVFDDLCVLAVEEDHAEQGVRALREVLRRDVLPVVVQSSVLDRLLDRLGPLAEAQRLGGLRRKGACVRARFSSLALHSDVLDALPLSGPGEGA